MIGFEITFRFTTRDGQYPGAFVRDYFKDGGMQRALDAATSTEANKILEQTYRGPDATDVGVTWVVWDA